MNQPDQNDPYYKIENNFVRQLQRFLENKPQVINSENQPNHLNIFPYQIEKINSAERFLIAQGLTNVQPMLLAFQETYMQFRAQFNRKRLIFRMFDLTHKINRAEIVKTLGSIQRRPTLNTPCSQCNIATFEKLFIEYKLPNNYPNDLQSSDFNKFLKRISASNCMISITEQYICSLNEFIDFLGRSNETIDQVMILRILNYINELLTKLSSEFSILVQNVDPQGIVFCCERRNNGFLSIKLDPQFISFSQLPHVVDNHQEGRHLVDIEKYHLEIIEKLYSFIVPGYQNNQRNRQQEVELQSAESIRQFLETVLPVEAIPKQRIRNIFETLGQSLQVTQFRENTILHILERYRMFPDEVQEREDENEEKEEDEDNEEDEEEKEEDEDADENEDENEDEDNEEDEEEQNDEDDDVNGYINGNGDDEYRLLPDLIPNQNSVPQNQIIQIKSLLLQLWQVSEREVNLYFRNNLLKQRYLQSGECQAIQRLLSQHGYTVREFSNLSMNSRGLLAQKEIQLQGGQSTTQEFYIKVYYLPTAHRETQQRLNNSVSNLQLVGEQIQRVEGDLEYYSASLIHDKNRYQIRAQQYQEQREQRLRQQQQLENDQRQQQQQEQANNVENAYEFMNVKPLIQTSRFSMIDQEDRIYNQGWEFVVFEKCLCSLRDLVPAIAMLSNEIKPIVLDRIYSGLYDFISHLDRLQLSHSELTLDRILIDKEGNLRINNCQATRSIRSPPIFTLEPLAAKILQLLSELDSEYVRQEYANGSYIELVQKVDRISIAMMMAELTFGLNHHKLIAEYLKNHRTIVQKIQESAGLIVHQADGAVNLNQQGNGNLNKLRLQQIDLFQNTQEAIRLLNVNIPRQGEFNLEDVQNMVLGLFEDA